MMSDTVTGYPAEIQGLCIQVSIWQGRSRRSVQCVGLTMSTKSYAPHGPTTDWSFCYLSAFLSTNLLTDLTRPTVSGVAKGPGVGLTPLLPDKFLYWVLGLYYFVCGAGIFLQPLTSPNTLSI